MANAPAPPPPSARRTLSLPEPLLLLACGVARRRLIVAHGRAWLALAPARVARSRFAINGHDQVAHVCVRGRRLDRASPVKELGQRAPLHLVHSIEPKPRGMRWYRHRRCGRRARHGVLRAKDAARQARAAPSRLSDPVRVKEENLMHAAQKIGVRCGSFAIQKRGAGQNRALRRAGRGRRLGAAGRPEPRPSPRGSAR